jgi:XTP/dITP diphosphohydrolase
MQLLVATGNAGKVKEIEHEMEVAGLLSGGIHLHGLKDLPPGWADVVEDRPTFVGNALKKARHFAQISGMLTLADDSGLCVDALDGAPGVKSARYAGEPCDNAANNAKLLREIDSIPDDKRQARFVCAMALATPTADLAVMVDDVHGVILRASRGTHGFGYDPLFFFPDLNMTTAELPMDKKSQISHRGKALRRMIAWMQQNRGKLHLETDVQEGHR